MSVWNEAGGESELVQTDGDLVKGGGRDAMDEGEREIDREREVEGVVGGWGGEWRGGVYVRDKERRRKKKKRKRKVVFEIAGLV